MKVKVIEFPSGHNRPEAEAVAKGLREWLLDNPNAKREHVAQPQVTRGGDIQRRSKVLTCRRPLSSLPVIFIRSIRPKFDAEVPN